MNKLFSRNLSFSSFVVDSFFSKIFIYVLPLIFLGALYAQQIAFEQQKMLLEQKLLMSQLDLSMKLAQNSNNGAHSILSQNISMSSCFGIALFIVGIFIVGALIQNGNSSEIMEKLALQVPKMIKENSEILGNLTDTQTKVLLDHNTFLAETNLKSIRELSNQIANLEHSNIFSNGLDFQTIQNEQTFYEVVNATAPLLEFFK
jgi:hypothetical protein